MLDENLPTFHFTPSPVSPLSTTIYETHDGCEPNAEYTITRPDPSLPAARNRYAIALYDSYSPEILYAEVLVQPEVIRSAQWLVWGFSRPRTAASKHLLICNYTVDSSDSQPDGNSECEWRSTASSSNRTRPLHDTAVQS